MFPPRAHASKQFHSALHRRRPSSRPLRQLAKGDIAPVPDVPIIPAVGRIATGRIVGVLDQESTRSPFMGLYHLVFMARIFSISVAVNARVVCVWTLPNDPRFSIRAVAVSSSGASNTTKQSKGPSVQNCCVTSTPIFFAAALNAAARLVVSRTLVMPCGVNLIVAIKVAIGFSFHGWLALIFSCWGQLTTTCRPGQFFAYLKYDRISRHTAAWA